MPLWIGRITLVLLLGIAAMATLGFAATGTRAVGTLALLLDSETKSVTILAKVFEAGLYWASAIAYWRGNRVGLFVTLLFFVALMAWSIAFDATTPGFRLRYLKNHIVEIIPCILVGVLLGCLTWSGRRN